MKQKTRPSKNCESCSLPSNICCKKCKHCGAMFNLRGLELQQKRPQILTYGFAKSFKEELDAIKQKPPGERKK